VPPVEIPDEPVAREKDGNGKKVAVAAAVKK
jgi:hypothetical protein